MILLLVILEAISGILLAIIPWFRVYMTAETGLTKHGKVLLGVSVSVLLLSIVGVKILSDNAAEVSQERNAELLDKIYVLMTPTVMTTPKDAELPPTTRSTGSLEILEPAEGSAIGQRQLVKGHIAERVRSLWLVVHPLETSSYWIQPRISASRSGNWSVMAYFGRGGSIDSGKTFELLAVADPETELQEGTNLGSWPLARLASAVVVVSRR